MPANCPYCVEADYFQPGRIHERDGVRYVEYWWLWCGRRHTPTRMEGKLDELVQALSLSLVRVSEFVTI
jgi:hypothetical protein